jgi:formate dehydrogenase major subunit
MRSLNLLAGAVPIGEIIQDVANRLGAGWKYEHPSEIYDEIAPLTPLMAGVTYERLEGYKTLQWPVAEDGSDQPLLYTKQFNFPDGKATFYPVPWSEPTDQQNAEYDLHLNNGRLLEHFHEGNMTYRTEGIREKTPCTFIEVSPELASERGIQTGSMAATDIALRQGACTSGRLPTRVQGKGALHAHELHRETRSIVSPAAIRTRQPTHPPTRKLQCSLVLPEIGEDPLPRTNSRHGHPTPQTGVEVERKWKRKDYRQPGDQLVQIQTR